MKLKQIPFIILIITLLGIACSTPKPIRESISNTSQSSDRLYDTIAHLDSAFFQAFNSRNLNELKLMISEDLEFYHDLGGVTNFAQNVEGFRKTFEKERRVRRELVLGSLEIHPIKGFGAIETGVHRFYAAEKGQIEKLSSEAKFVHVWQRKNKGWQITRIISYGHQEYLK